MTTTTVGAIPPIGHDEAMVLAATEYGRFGELLAGLGPDDWTRPTVCEPWDVRALATHVLGSAEAAASMRVNIAQKKAAGPVMKEAGFDHIVDAVNEVQVRERADLTPAQVLERWADVVPRAIRGRQRFPRILRPLPIRFPEPTGRRTMAYLWDIAFTRQTWMHRIDIARAIAHQPVLTAGHDGRLIADTVADWTSTHGQPFTLRLTGPAGGTYVNGDGGEEVEIDAVEWMWTITGRASSTGLLERSLAL
ncbi:MAG TPA: maleylpyruvate isomerase family mycothiol-dependent enzyme [Acidimicrobiales bacterium]|nr:maleylpyruvate isomerase family mycothiol-dependent enzyme [Acidimicrobiales bacterium]